MTESGHWVLRHTQKQHFCPTPVGTFGSPLGDRGEIWQCGGCGQHWLVDFSPLNSLISGLVWNTISDQKAGRLIRRNRKRVSREMEV